MILTMANCAARSEPTPVQAEVRPSVAAEPSEEREVVVEEGVTAWDQSNDVDDIEITAEIRKALVADDSLSTDAQNVKIITVERNVTLRGPVKSEAERQQVVNKARAIAGDDRVTNLLTLSVH